jgi:exodeoxyribonuclease VII large subunit
MITLKKLNDIIKLELPKTTYHIKGEVSTPKISGGHLYFGLKDETGKINCIMWKYNLTEEISKIKNGDNIEIKCQLNFYIARGELNFVLNWGKIIDNTGDLNKQFELMKLEFKKLGYFDKKIKLKPYIKKIAIITSLNGAAIHDFVYTLEKSNVNIDYIELDAQVQGTDCPRQIIDNLTKYDFCPDTTDIDLVIITRGGGSKEDLWGFNDKKLIETVYNRDFPVLSAIGHMIDITLLDYVADISTPTPSLAAQYIVDYNNKYLDKLKHIKDNIKNNLIDETNKNLSILDKLSLKKNELIYFIKNKIDRYKQNIIFEIKENINKLDNLLLSYKTKNNIELYEKSTEFYKLNFEDFKILINNNKPFTLVWNDVVINVNSYDLNITNNN